MASRQAILKRIRGHGRGWVFTPKAFVDLGKPGAIRVALVRLSNEGIIRRLSHGIYDFPRKHKKLGVLAPNPDEVAAALAAKSGSRIQVSGSRAANLLGLTEQVPAQLIYLTDGPAQRVKIGSQTVHLKRTRPSKFPGVGTRAGLAIQAIRAVGPKADRNFVFRQLSRKLDSNDKMQLAMLAKYAPAWSYELIQKLNKA